jgi:hypothetical protein
MRSITWSDAEILAQPERIDQLRAINSGLVVRGAPAGDTTMWARHRAVGFEVRQDVVLLAKLDLVHMPISGPPRLAPRGRRLLAIANGEIAMPLE